VIGAARLQRRLPATLIEAGLVGTAGLVDQVSRFVLSIVAAAAFGPVLFGAWSLISTLIQYANILSLGVPTGAARSVPVARGRGDAATVTRIEGTARTAGLATSLLSGIVVAAIVYTGLDQADMALVAVVVGIAVVVQQQVVLDQSLLRSRLAFHRAASESLAQGIVGLVAGLLLLPFELVGLGLSRLIASAVALAVGWPARTQVARYGWDRATAIDLVRHGFPIAVSAALFGLLITIDRWLVLGLLGPEALGHFSLASTVFAGLLMVSTLVSQQHLARTAFRFGADASPAGLLQRARHQGLVALGPTAVAAVLALVGAFIVIPRWLPEYGPALAPMTIAAVGAVCYSPTSGYANVLGILRRGRDLLVLQAAALVVLVVVAVTAATAGLGLAGIAIATASSLVGFGVSCALMARRVVTRAGAAR
jgi:O-antigen/teichoic acid export membrane protein